MAFRDPMLALQTRVTVLEGEVRRQALRAEAAEEALAEARGELEEIRRGASREQDLREDLHFNLAHVLLPVGSVVGAVWAVVLRAVIYGDTFGTFDPSMRGVAEFASQLEEPGAVPAVALVALALLVAALPIVAAVGLSRRRRWGWTWSVVSYVPFVIALPPLGLYGLFALCRTRTISAFFDPRRAELDAELEGV